MTIVPPMKMATASTIPYMLGGLGLAALENKFVGDELPPELKSINYGLGAGTGWLFAQKDPKLKALAIGSLPAKQLGLFGIGAMDKLRRQQQSLVDANLAVADVNKDTANINRSNASSDNATKLLFLLPALAAGAGVGYLGYEKWRKAKQQIPRYQTVGERGRESGSRSKIRIDIPANAVPEEFYQSLASPEDQGKAHLRLLRLSNPDALSQASRESMAALTGKEARAIVAFNKKAATEERVSIPGMLMDVGAEITGLPALGRGMQDFGMAAGSFASDEGKNTARYGLGTIGNLIGGAVGLKFGLLPLMARMAGPSRMLAHMGKSAPRNALAWAAANPGKVQLQKPLLRFPWLAKAMWRNSGAMGKGNWAHGGVSGSGFGRFAVDSARDKRWAYRPGAFAFDGSGSGGYSPIMRSLYKNFFSQPVKGPTSLPGHAMHLLRYGGNRAMQGGHYLGTMMRRSPNATLGIGAIPLSMMGYQRDKERDEAARRELAHYMPEWAKNRGHFGTPITSNIAQVQKLIGAPDVSTGLRDQLANTNSSNDPFSPWR